MSVLIEKSDMNQEAAQLLHRKEMYAPAIHCSYYSCLQILKHIWLYHSYKSETELKSEKNSHKALINNAEDFLKKQKDEELPRLVVNLCLDLKSSRVKSDYSTNKISKEVSSKALNDSKSAIIKLKAALQ